jgi:hypothetical protein
LLALLERSDLLFWHASIKDTIAVMTAAIAPSSVAMMRTTWATDEVSAGKAKHLFARLTP